MEAAYRGRWAACLIGALMVAGCTGVNVYLPEPPRGAALATDEQLAHQKKRYVGGEGLPLCQPPAAPMTEQGFAGGHFTFFRIHFSLALIPF
jgi:hypothetical protein